MMICPNCRKNQANRHPVYGVLACDECNGRGKIKFQKQAEFTTEEIRRGRKEFYKDALQPFRHGELSKEYLDAHGSKNLTVSEGEIKSARKVWSDLNYYSE